MDEQPMQPEPPQQWAGPTKRSQEEIVARVKEITETREDSDLFYAERGDLISQLDFEHGKQFAREGVTEAEWNASAKPDPWLAAEAYLDFAWSKIQAERGLSARRSYDHVRAWAWLIDDSGEGFRVLEEAPWGWYGDESLAAFCAYFGMRWPREE